MNDIKGHFAQLTNCFGIPDQVRHDHFGLKKKRESTIKTCSENKGADQLRGYCVANLTFAFAFVCQTRFSHNSAQIFCYYLGFSRLPGICIIRQMLFSTIFSCFKWTFLYENV